MRLETMLSPGQYRSQYLKKLEKCPKYKIGYKFIRKGNCESIQQIVEIVYLKNRLGDTIDFYYITKYSVLDDRYDEVLELVIDSADKVE